MLCLTIGIGERFILFILCLSCGERGVLWAVTFALLAAANLRCVDGLWGDPRRMRDCVRWNPKDSCQSDARLE